MKFSLTKSIEILERTPETLSLFLRDLSEDWTSQNEGGESWTVYDIIGHLIHGEKTDWMIRAELILSDETDKQFIPFDRFAQFKNSKGKSLASLLTEFSELRKANLEKLRKLNIEKDDLEKTGIHPVFGSVTLSQLLSAWVVHDLNHLAQIARVMAKQYQEQVGPWTAFLKIVND